MFPMTITLHNIDDLNRVTAVLAPTATPKVEETATAKKPNTSAATPAPAARTQPTAEAAAETAAPAKTADEPRPTAASAEAAPQASTAVEYDTVKAAILNLSTSKGKAAAVEVLGKFGLVKLPDAKPEQYADILAAANAALAG